MSLNLPGSIIISGLAFLENVRTPNPEKPKTLAFDAVFCLSDGCGPEQDAAVAHLTYYNADNLNFIEESTPYFIVAKVCDLLHKSAALLLTLGLCLVNLNRLLKWSMALALPLTHQSCSAHPPLLSEMKIIASLVISKQ